MFTEKQKTVLDKAERILKSNIYTQPIYPWGKYRMICPDKTKFKGIWNWDSAFHAIGILPFDTELAEEQITGFVQFQMPDGMLPDNVLESGSIGTNLSKPPVMAAAAVEVFKKAGNVDFLKKLYPRMIVNEQFWVNKRCEDGLFHYDAARNDLCDEKTYLTRVGWETGWDNSPRWDTSPHHLWAIDLNCYMVMHYRALEYMARQLNEDYQQWDKKASSLAQLIEQRLWNDEIGAYTDFNFVTKEPSKVLTPASFMPLYIGIAPDCRAEQMNKIAKAHFLPGMPSVAYDHEAYSTAYWRGPCWLNVAYFAAKGLKDYGFADTAEIIRDTIVDWVYNDTNSVHENYDSKTGKGLCSEAFSWSCVFIREFIMNI